MSLAQPHGWAFLMVFPVVITVFRKLIRWVRNSPFIEVQKQHIIWIDAQEVVEQQETNNRPGLVSPGLLPHPGACWTIEVFSPLLPW